MIQANELVIEIGTARLLHPATFSLHPGDKVGLVGRNGAGKTSLLKVLAGELTPVEGRLIRRGAIGHVRQDPASDGASGATALARIVSARGLDEDADRLEKLRVALEESPTRGNIARFSQAEELYRAAGGYSVESEARRVAAGLGLSHDRLDLPASALSGGERRRVELARVLFAGSDLLLLDEPTNHLDTDAKAWLMKFLAAYRGALLVVSHDLYLLDQAITRILHLDDDRLIEYRGTYSQYKVARRLDEQQAARVGERQQREIRRLKTLADSMRHQTEKRARIAKSLDTRVQRMRAAAVSAPQRERRINVRFPEPPRAGRVVLDATGLSKSYGGPPVFHDVSFDVGRSERLFVMGLNGAGKTTLLRILAGVNEADSGSVVVGTGVSIGYYAQEHEGITAGQSVLSHMKSQSRAPDQQLRALLGMFGLTGEIAFQDAGTLSGGEKTKLALAQLVAGRCNVLLLDEPTNNLDPSSLDATGRALSEWPGAMVIVSHDRDFVKQLAPDRVLMMPEGTLDYWSNDLLELVSLA
jgi:ATPase subunit of ABC transporter with duplicated ATPase domains